jgi:hypothetical protein
VSTAELLLGVAADHRSALIERAIAEQWDQMRVRDELQAAQSPAELNQPRKLPTAAAQQPPVLANSADRPRPGSRPPGFTRTIREFYRTVLTIRSEDLTSADRSAMRTLFKALVMLARAQTTPKPTVFPPLPEQRASRRQQTRSSTLNRQKKR